jgi:acyl-CoA thioesterase FadM
LKKPTYRYLSEIAFSDTDASGRAHFTRMLNHVEKAEHAFLASIGIPVCSETCGWPRAKISCDFRSPLRFQDSFSVVLQLNRIGTSSLNWVFKILKPDATLVAEGEWVTVKVAPDGSPAAITEDEKRKILAE